MARRLLAGLALLGIALGAPSLASAQCGVFKVFGLNEVLTSSDLNQAFSRTVTANVASCATGDSPSVGQMRVVVDPYPGSAESLPTTVQGELERLRFQLQAAVGKTYWYQPIDNSLAKDVSKHWGATFTSYAEMVTPPTPPGPNDLRLYATDDGSGVTVLAYKDSAGIINTLTGPSTSYGSSVTVNYVAKNNPGTPDTRIDLSADRISVGGFIKAGFTTTLDLTTTGANALDTGTIAVSTGYAIWIIYNPATNTFASLASTSETAPTMPTGYTRKRLMSKFTTDGSAHLVGGVQTGRSMHYTVTTAQPMWPACFGPGGPVQVNTLQLYVPNAQASSATLLVYLRNNVGALTRTFKAGSLSFSSGASAIGAPVHTTVESAQVGYRITNVTLPLRNPVNRGTIFVEVTVDCADFYLTGWEIEWPD